MQTPTFGTYALSFLLAGVGGWALNESLQQHDAPAVSPASAPAPAAPVTINLGDGPATAAVAGRTPSVPTVAGTGTAVRTGPTTGATRALGSLAHAGARPVTTSAASRAHRVAVRAAAPARAAGRGRATAGARRLPRGIDSSLTQLLLAPTTYVGGSGNITATNGAIVLVGDGAHLVANTGQTSTSGVVALGVSGSDLASGTSQQPVLVQAPGVGPTGAPAVTSANGSFASVAGGHSSVAMSGFEDHSVTVVGNGQVTTYDDSNVFIDRDGHINANTGDTDSSGLNAVDVTDSTVRSGDSGDGPDDDAAGDEDEVAAGPATAPADSPADRGAQDVDTEAGAVAAPRPAPRAAAPVGVPSTRTPASAATVADEGDSTATGTSSLVVGADGFDDVSVRTQGDRNVTSYDDSNVVIGGHGDVNAQIGDSDTGGAVVMGIHGSDVRAGCEGDRCVTGSTTGSATGFGSHR